MLEAARTADVVIGSRLAPGADVVKQPFHRRLAGATFLRLSKAVMREPARDVYCGFKLWSAEAADTVYSRARLDGWVFDAETLALARRLGFRAAEVGIVWVNRARLASLDAPDAAARAAGAARRTAERPARAQAPAGDPESAVEASARG